MNRIILVACFVLFGATSLCLAGIRPSFELYYSTWHAADIVVVSANDDSYSDFSVVEVWKGQLSRGDLLNINELCEFKDKSKRIVKPIRPIKGEPQIVVSGKRMILFLKSDLRGGRSWQAAMRFGGMKVSTVWVEGENTYTFTQVINPGPSVLVTQMCHESKMQKMVMEIIAIQRELKKVANIVTPVKRAIKAAPFTKSNVYYVRKEAFNILSHCNSAALPVLRKMLTSESHAAQHSKIIDVMVIAGGSEIGPELTKMVSSELKFWQTETPSLEKGWWSGKGLAWSRCQQLRNRYCKVLHLFYALRKLKFNNAESSVRAFRDYWQSQPKLNEKNGLNQMSQACDDFLKEQTLI